jgi:hypothetical protein
MFVYILYEWTICPSGENLHMAGAIVTLPLGVGPMHTAWATVTLPLGVGPMHMAGAIVTLPLGVGPMHTAGAIVTLPLGVGPMHMAEALENLPLGVGAMSERPEIPAQQLTFLRHLTESLGILRATLFAEFRCFLVLEREKE